MRAAIHDVAEVSLKNVRIASLWEACLLVSTPSRARIPARRSAELCCSQKGPGSHEQSITPPKLLSRQAPQVTTSPLPNHSVTRDTSSRKIGAI